MMGFFEDDCKFFEEACQKNESSITPFKGILDKLTNLKIEEELFKRIEFHSTLINYRIKNLDNFLNPIWDDYLNKNDEIFSHVTEQIGQAITFPPIPEEFESLTSQDQEIVTKALELMKENHIRLVVAIGGFVNSIFFAFEAECKILCSLGCFAFSIRYAQNGIVNHTDVWKALKRMGRLDELQQIDCMICALREDCKQELCFKNLANIYCYAIKIRMLSDYEDFFYEYEHTWEKLKLFFDKIKLVISCQELLKQKTLPGELN